MKNMTLIIAALALACGAFAGDFPRTVKISKEALADKIRGGWAGQMIGCSYGGPTEFKYNNKTIPDDVKIAWGPNSIRASKGRFGGLYDDLYLDITFMDVFERLGLDAPRSAFQKALAEGDFPLWCANREARNNYFDGVNPDEPTSWKTNIKSDDIDFQIEADFAGLMSPALPHAALFFADKVGRAINGGDGFYCGVYVATMYSLAFAINDINEIVESALEVVPKESDTYKMMKSVIAWHKENPKDWKYAWQNFEDTYVGPFQKERGAAGTKSSIYAPYNCGYILIGLLYGNGDFGKTIEISTRCGFDSDCNPSSAGGILGAMLGYSHIPEEWRAPLEPLEKTIVFQGTTYTFDKTCAVGYTQALRVLERYGVNTEKNELEISCALPPSVPFEEPMPDVKVSKKSVAKLDAKNPAAEFEFDGCGVKCSFKKFDKEREALLDARSSSELAAEADVYVDGKPARTAKFFCGKNKSQRNLIFSLFGLPEGKHKVEIKLVKAESWFPTLDVDFSGFAKK